MERALRKEVPTAIEPEIKRDHCDCDSVLDSEGVQAHLEADLELDPGGDAIAGILNGVLIGALIWGACAAVVVLILIEAR